MPLKLAIVGRPNVGKSTLFNRLAGRRLAIVNDQPGVTRDRRTAPGRLGDIDLELIDTAGFEDVTDESLEARMRAQTEQAIDDADLCLFVFDAREGITPLDRIFADLLRRRDKPVIVVANKAEGKVGELGAADAFSVGLGPPIPLSAEHGEGISDLYDAVLAAYPGAGEDEEDKDGADKPVMIAIVGRPNAGKSTLVNRLLGEDRLLTGPEAGITRDAISVDWTWEGRPIRLVDTAGLRRKARVQETLEKLSTHDSIRAITFAEVVILVMDANNAFETQDLQLADLVEREGRGLIFCISKWDLVENQAERLAQLREQADAVLPQVRGTPMIALSAETGRGMERLMPAVFGMHKNWSTKVKTRDLNDWLALAVQRHPPPAVGGKRIKPKYMAQLKGRPPTFVLFASRADHLPESYRRYLINSLRESFDLPGVPIRITIKANRNPYAEEGDGNRSVAASPDGPSKAFKKKIAARKKATVAEITPAPRPAKPAKAKPAAPKSFRVGAGKAGPQKAGPKRSEVKAAQGKAMAKRSGQRTPTTHKLRKPAVKKGPPKR